jgi:hypothetical protein
MLRHDFSCFIKHIIERSERPPNQHIRALVIQKQDEHQCVTFARLKRYIKIYVLHHPSEIRIILAAGIFFNIELGLLNFTQIYWSIFIKL